MTACRANQPPLASPVEIPEEDMALDASFSQKVPVSDIYISYDPA